jgi:hypothetical protein
MNHLVLSMVLALSAFSAQAWDGIVTGKISRIDGAGGSAGSNNFDFRVSVAGAPVACSVANSPSWSYLNPEDANYKGLMALIMFAYATGKTITIHSNKGPTPSTAGYCQIGYVAIID